MTTPTSSTGPAEPDPSGGSSDSPTLVRRMGLFLLILYGVGDMVGSGIYGTIGDAAAQMGNAIWLSFTASMVVALFTGFSYACLASRYPRAAGAAYITERAYHWAFLSFVVGLAVTASGMTSMATNSHVFSNNLASFLAAAVPGPVAAALPWLIAFGFVGIVTLINFWGIRESMWANVLCTAIEVGGLLLVIAVGMQYWGSVNYLETPVPAGEQGGGLDLWLITSGAVLTFFAFVGFEDMLNVSEEVKSPERTMPWGMVIALVITALLYLATSITAVSVVDYQRLDDTDAPMAHVVRVAADWLPPWVLTVITMFAAANSVLINYIMGSRMLYGMARQGLLPGILGRVHPGRRTPHVAILALMVVVLILVAIGNIAQLANATSLLLLFVFCLVNAALIVLKLRPSEARGTFEVPIFVPFLGALSCLGLIGAKLSRVLVEPAEAWVAPAIAAGLIVFISLLYLLQRRHRPQS